MGRGQFNRQRQPIQVCANGCDCLYIFMSEKKIALERLRTLDEERYRGRFGLLVGRAAVSTIRQSQWWHDELMFTINMQPDPTRDQDFETRHAGEQLAHQQSGW